MAAWDTGPFDNDAARDWLARVRHPDVVAEALRGDDDEALAAAGVVAWAAGVLSEERMPHPLMKHRRTLRGLQSQAARACERLLADSEIRTLWEESGRLSTWSERMESLIRCLGGVVESRPAELMCTDGAVPPSGAPEPEIDLPRPIEDMYRQNRTVAAHTAFAYELSQPRYLEYHPAELLVLGVHRTREVLLVLEMHQDRFLRVLHWSQERGASVVDLFDDWSPDPPEETTCFETSDGCHLWLAGGPGAANLLAARDALRWAYGTDDLLEVERAERVLARAQHEVGRSREARHHADAGRLVEVAVDDEPALLPLAGAIYGTALDNRDQRRVHAALLTPLCDQLHAAGLADTESVTRAAARRGDIASLLLTNADDRVVEQACVAASPKQVLEALEATRSAAIRDSLRQRLATTALGRGMDAWTLAEVQSLVALGARATPFARRKARRRPDHQDILSLVSKQRDLTL